MIWAETFPDLTAFGAAGSSAILAFIVLKLIADHREDRRELLKSIEAERAKMIETLTGIIDTYRNTRELDDGDNHN